MRTRVGWLLVIAACGPSLTGDGEHDLEELTDAAEVQCTCSDLGCMTDALSDGVIAEHSFTERDSPANPNHYDVHYFTYEGEIVVISESFADPGYGTVSEYICKTITPVAASATSSCWDVSDCE